MIHTFDSHIHLDLIEGFGPTTAIGRAPSCAFVPGVRPAGTRDALRRMGDDPRLTFGAAWHPWHIPDGEPRMDELRALMPEVCAVGETGLDHARHRDKALRERAARWFVAHIELAVAFGKPLVVHCVRAHGACLELLRTHHASRVGGVVHGFTGSLETAREYARLGFAVGMGPAIARARHAARVVREHDARWLLAETDAPFARALREGEQAGHGFGIEAVLEQMARLRKEEPDRTRARNTSVGGRVGLHYTGTPSHTA